MEAISEILNKISLEDVEKLRVLLSIMPDYAQTEVITLRVFCNEYRNLIKNNRSENYYNSVNISLKHLTDYFSEQRAISSISIKDVELFIIYLRKKVNKGYRVYYRTLKAAFNKALDWNYIKENHLAKVKLPKQQKINPNFINGEQLHLICSKIEIDVVREFVITAFYTGMRLNELVNLKWSNVDLEKRIITVGDDEFKTKGRKQRYIPICEDVYKILEKRKMRKELTKKLEQEKNENTKKDFSVLSLYQNDIKKFVFGKQNGSAFTGDYFSKKFKKACREADLDESIHFHTLRHSFASNLAQKGVSLYVIKELLGHSSISTTEIYSHLNVDSLREAVDKLNNSPLNLPLKSNGKIFETSEALKLIECKG